MLCAKFGQPPVAPPAVSPRQVLFAQMVGIAVMLMVVQPPFVMHFPRDGGVPRPSPPRVGLVSLLSVTATLHLAQGSFKKCVQVFH